MFNDYLFMSNPNHNMCSHWGVVGPEKIHILKDIEEYSTKAHLRTYKLNCKELEEQKYNFT